MKRKNIGPMRAISAAGLSLLVSLGSAGCASRQTASPAPPPKRMSIPQVIQSVRDNPNMSPAQKEQAIKTLETAPNGPPGAQPPSGASMTAPGPAKNK